MIQRIEALRETLSVDWVDETVRVIEEQIRRPKKLPAVEVASHPIGELFHRVLPALKSGSASRYDIARLGAIAEDVLTPLESDVAGAESRLERLKSEDLALVDSTLYEFGVATMLLRRGHAVRFLKEKPTEGARTPDLLVDESVEVECKRRGTTRQEAEDRELWELFNRRAVRLITSKQRSLAIEFFSADGPTRDGVDWALRELRRQLSGDASLPIEEEMDGHHLLVRKIEVCGGNGGIVAQSPDPAFPREFERLEMMALARGTQLDASTGTAIICRCGTRCREGREPGISNSLDTARKQFSGDSPGVVFLDLQLPIAQPSQADLEPASEVIQDWLRQHRSVAAVVLTTDWVAEQGGRLLMARRRLVLRKDDVRHRLDPTFSL